MTGNIKDDRDEASIFKQRSFDAIRRKRKLKKFTFSAMIFIALTMMIAVLISYAFI